jgi:hypothetical protein
VSVIESLAPTRGFPTRSQAPSERRPTKRLTSRTSVLRKRVDRSGNTAVDSLDDFENRRVGHAIDRKIRQSIPFASTVKGGVSGNP